MSSVIFSSRVFAGDSPQSRRRWRRFCHRLANCVFARSARSPSRQAIHLAAPFDDHNSSVMSSELPYTQAYQPTPKVATTDPYAGALLRIHSGRGAGRWPVSRGDLGAAIATLLTLS